MQILCALENMSATGFTGSRLKLKLALEVADAYSANLPKGMDLADEFTYVDDTIRLIVVPRGQAELVDTAEVTLMDQKIVTSVGSCIDRRKKAKDENTPVVALPTDTKHLHLNKTVHDAVAAGVVPAISGSAGDIQEITSVEPRKTVLVEPPAEPFKIEGDYLISGSNVVGIHQLELFADTDVDIVFFLHGANFDEIRLRGPLRLAAVANMATRVRGEFMRDSPKDRHLTCQARPEFYSLG